MRSAERFAVRASVLNSCSRSIGIARYAVPQDKVAAALSAPGQAALLFCVDMNQRCGHAACYITPMSYRAEQSAKRGGKRLQQQRFLLGEDGAEVEDQAVFFDAGDDGDACGGAA